MVYKVICDDTDFEVSTNMRYGDMTLLKDTLESYGHSVRYVVPFIDDVNREIVFKYPANHPVMIKKSTIDNDTVNTHWIGYIEIGKKVHIIKDMHDINVIEIISNVHVGDGFNIKGLGKLKVTSVNRETEEEDGTNFIEVIITCSKVG